MNIGALNRRITIQQQSTSQDSVGQQLQTWTDFYKCWASIQIQNSALIYETAQFIEDVIYRITFRWTSSVVFEPNMRIVHNEATTGVAHTYVIKAFMNTDAANKQIVCLCHEIDGSE